jgi:hypothetical protein
MEAIDNYVEARVKAVLEEEKNKCPECGQYLSPSLKF